MDSVPLFEREHRRDGQLVQRLQSELADAKRFVEAQARRQNDLEYVNEDLERRLEQEALDRIKLDAQKAEDERCDCVALRACHFFDWICVSGLVFISPTCEDSDSLLRINCI